MSGSLRRLAGLVSSAAGKIKRGKALLEEGKPAEAFKLLAPVAKAGHAEAEFLVARCYLEGRGVPPSAAEGARWLERAATQGFLEAQSMIAALYLRGIPGMEPGAALQGEAGALLGDRPAAALFGASEAGKPDYEKAVAWATKAAEGGSADGQALLGFILTSGPEALRDVASQLLNRQT